MLEAILSSAKLRGILTQDQFDAYALECDRTMKEMDFLCARVKELESQLSKMREALDKYGRHFGECAFNNPGIRIHIGVSGCTCGFSKAISPRVGGEGENG